MNITAIIEKKHYEFLDLAKGVGIMLVILGHGMFPNHYLIDSFHMPMFFILSGLTFVPPAHTYTSESIMIMEWVGKKVERIFVPSIFFMLVSGVVEIVVGKINPDTAFNSPLWFLQTLFISLLIYAFLMMKFGPKLCTVISLLAAIATYINYAYINNCAILPFHLARSIAAIPFLHTGYLLSNNIKTSSKQISVGLSIVCLLLFCVCLGFVLHRYNTIGLSFVEGSIFTYNPIFPWIISISGSLLVVYLSRIVNCIRLLNWLGKNSLVIMCVHFPILERLNHLCSLLPLYTTFEGKLFLAFISYAITIMTSIVMVILCKRYIPSLTGYKRLLSA